jgi:hypothetical protein
MRSVETAVYCIYLPNFCTFLASFLVRNGGAKIMQGIFGKHCFRGEFHGRSGIRYPILRLEMKHFSVIM